MFYNYNSADDELAATTFDCFSGNRRESSHTDNSLLFIIIIFLLLAWGFAWGGYGGYGGFGGYW